MAIRLKHLPKDVQKRILDHEKQSKPKRPNKYRNQKCVVDGESFDSKLEGSVWSLLQRQLKAGEITRIERQPPVLLTSALILFRADFRIFFPDGSTCLVEAKGKETASYRIKLRLFREYGEERLRVFKGSWKRPVEVEGVVPKRLQ